MELKFKDGKFVIMQVSDAQDLHWVRPTMIRMLNTAYDMIKPDFIALTGDNILGNHLCDARFGSRKVVTDVQGERAIMEKAIDKLCAPIEKRRIPFAMIFGNHDDMNNITKQEQADIFKKYSSNIPYDSGDCYDCSTYNIPIMSSDGSKVAFNLWMFDSAWQDKETKECHCAVTKGAVDWYKQKSAELKVANGGKPVPSFLFQHIPIKEEMELIEECPIWKEGAAPGPDGKFFRLKPGKNIRGEIGEYPCVCDEDNGEFDAMLKGGDVKAMIFGHDHMNSFEAPYKGIDFIQTPCASFRCYGDRKKGVRVFVIDEATGTYETEVFSYDEICGGGFLNEVAYMWDADDMVKTKAAIIAVSTAVLGTAAAVGIRHFNKFRK